MKRTILSVAYPLTRVGDDAVGGSEQILASLDNAFTQAGHHSLVIAAEGSRVKGTLIPSPAAPRHLDDGVREAGRSAHRRLIMEALQRYPVDLVHMHSLDFHCYVPPGKIPTLATLHLPPDWYPSEIFEKRGRVMMNCVSRSQHQSCPPSPLLLDFIPNGVDTDRLRLDTRKRGFTLAVGRICPEKGFHFALDAARLAGMKLILAGEIFPYDSHLEYFKKEISPRLNEDRKFVGPVDFTAKRRLLSQAKCLIIPSTVAETSSLVAMEALACGTPVIAFPSGALPDIVEHGVTGLIVQDLKEMAGALREIDRIQPEACRAAARARFSVRTMQARYLDLYERLIHTQPGQDYRTARSRTCAWAMAT